ncbi:endodeoxyribonuclease RusA [Peptoniphilus asaccharolyticus DSM 20463]|uniref:Endodeoxyribonuclease RusA n=1 Tax=Peptoniphilus asaccharolyticus DSM 20463 TaxID=573058 RepID=A0A1W1V1G5_PEPAS|nr:hypothetical protein [Peptoniphilus asaccharolyticus]SMB87199.1 endodeoxyribonuclease RusA [Peptoniphilus asaccharolyticus DSM 20463]
MNLILYGRPITKKNSSRIIKHGNSYKLIPSKQFIAYERDCIRQITGKHKKGFNGHYNLKCVYYMPTKGKVDLVNLLAVEFYMTSPIQGLRLN